MAKKLPTETLSRIVPDRLGGRRLGKRAGPPGPWGTVTPSTPIPDPRLSPTQAGPGQAALRDQVKANGQQGRERLIALCESALGELLAERAAARTRATRLDLDGQIATVREILRGAARR